MVQVEGASGQHFTITEASLQNNRWQYTAATDTTQDENTWEWSHASWTQDSCDETTFLLPASNKEGDTQVSSDYQQVTVEIWQTIDTAWICFSLECDDGSRIYARIRNLQTESTVTSESCGSGSEQTPPANNPPVNNQPPQEEEEEETNNPLIQPEIQTDDEEQDCDIRDPDGDCYEGGPGEQRSDDDGYQVDNEPVEVEPKSPASQPVNTDPPSNQKSPDSNQGGYNGPWK